MFDPRSFLGYKHGNYSISNLIGLGAHGVVYRARHTFLERAKAVKVLLPSAVDAVGPSLVRRFQNESMAACAIDHDHIVDIEDSGELLFDGQLLYYIDMEFLEGRNLGATLVPPECPRGQMLDLARLLRIFTTTADALAVAHARGIVHRDITPSNIFLSHRKGRTDYVKVLDFGVARLSGDLSPGLLTKTGTQLGNAEWASPEVIRGLHPDGRTDVWSLGAVLYRALTGSSPFGDDNESLIPLHVMNDEPVPVARRRPGLPPQLVRIVELALRKDPEERPTMRELWDLLNDSADAAPRPITHDHDITTSTPVVRTVPPAITIDPARVRSAPSLPATRYRRDD